MNKEEQMPEWIDRYNRNELSSEELKEFISILEKDPELRKEVKLDQHLNEILKEKDVINLRKKLMNIRERNETRNFHLTIYFLAACCVFLLGVTIHYFLVWNELHKKLLVPVKVYSLFDTSWKHRKEVIKPNQIEIDMATIDSAQARERRGDSSIRKRVRAMFAQNYDPFPPFEDLVGEIMRDGNFTLDQPLNSKTFAKGEKIQFSWRSMPVQSFELEITDNQGKSVFHSYDIVTQTLKIDTLKLTPGLYYFKFLKNDELIYFGKFFVK